MEIRDEDLSKKREALVQRSQKGKREMLDEQKEGMRAEYSSGRESDSK